MDTELERIAAALERIATVLEETVRGGRWETVAEDAKYAAMDEYSATVGAAWEKYKDASDEEFTEYYRLVEEARGKYNRVISPDGE
jgi:hypothetical protein